MWIHRIIKQYGHICFCKLIGRHGDTVTTTIPIMALLIVSLFSVFLVENLSAGGSQITSNETYTLQPTATMYQSISDSFTITVPNGWAINEVHSTDTDALLSERMRGVKLVAQLCPEE